MMWLLGGRVDSRVYPRAGVINLPEFWSSVLFCSILARRENAMQKLLHDRGFIWLVVLPNLYCQKIASKR